MRILWICNIIPDPVAEKLGINKSLGGGWITGSFNAIQGAVDIEVAVSFPQELSKSLLKGDVNRNPYYGFPASKVEVGKYDVTLEKWFKEIIEDYQPDIVHIWGTEFAHSLAVARVFNCPNNTICSIQGVCTAIATHYRSGLPMTTVYGWTLRDLLKWDNVWLREKQFWNRGRIEVETLKLVKHVIGRTVFDRAYAKRVNSEIQYYYCSETLRDIFYFQQNSWKYEECEKHSIFVSSASYPLKGFHKVLEAMPTILKRFPDAKVYVIGNDPRELPFYRMSKYYQYVKRMIEKLGLNDSVIYLGWLDEQEMCRRFLKSNVFISSSNIENSSNAIGEAMMLGMPIVASYVGGTMDLLIDKKEGYLYQSDAPYMLAEYVCRIFESEGCVKEMGERAFKHASKLYDKQANVYQLKNIYETVYELSKG